MRWPFRRGKHRADRHPAPPVTADQTAAAIEESVQALRAAEARDPEVRSIIKRLRDQADENHFSELLADTFKGDR